MPSNELLAAQIKRLLRLPFAPRVAEDAAAIGAEYRRILAAGLRSDVAVEAVVDDIIEHAEEMPAPAVVMGAVRRWNEADSTRILKNRLDAAGEAPADWDRRCAICLDSGFESYEEDREVNGQLGTYSFARACRCSLGRRLAEARRIEAERKAQKKRAARESAA